MQLETFVPGQIKIQPGEVAKLNRAVSDLYVGQVLKTVVVKAINDHSVMININGNNINAQTAHRYQPGQELIVQVAKQGEEVHLKIQPQANLTQLIQQAISQNITQQMPINQILSQIGRLIQSNQVPAQLQLLIQNWSQSLPMLNQLSQLLPSLVGKSGLFFESKLQKLSQGSSQSINNDLKGLFFRLLALAQQGNAKVNLTGLSPNIGMNVSPKFSPLPLPGAVPQPLQTLDQAILFNDKSLPENQLHYLAKAGLARITSQQLSHLGLSQNQTNYQIMLDLPFRVNDRVEFLPLLIKQEPYSQESSLTTWTAQFALNLENIGALQAKVHLTYKTLGIEINVENAHSEKILANIKPMLADWAQNQGLKLGRWQIHYGLEPNNFHEQSFSMVDIEL